MDYKRIHDTFISYFKDTTPADRLKKRCPSDERLTSVEKIYVERHHIIPRAAGGGDMEENLVYLLPEEHIFIHFLQWKAYRSNKDLCAVNYMINGFLFYKNNRITDVQLTRILRTNFKRKRIEFGKFISENNKGNSGISEARKGTMPVKDAITWEIIGSVPVDHPKVLSGEWVHHSKGVKLTEEHRAKVKDNVQGFKNPNAHKFSNEEYMEQVIEYVKHHTIDGRFIICEYRRYCEKNNLVCIKCFSPMRWGSFTNFMKALCVECNKRGIPFQYDPYFRSEEQREKLSKIQSSRRREYSEDGKFHYVEK